MAKTNDIVGVSVLHVNKTEVQYTIHKELPETVDADLLAVGYPVEIVCNKILSNGTKGKITGFSVNLRKQILCHVHWLEGAPPIRLKPEFVKSRLPKKFWMVAPQNNQAQYSQQQSLEYRRAGLNAPTKKCTTKSEADGELARLTKDYPHLEWVILEVTGTTFNKEVYPV